MTAGNNLVYKGMKTMGNGSAVSRRRIQGLAAATKQSPGRESAICLGLLKIREQMQDEPSTEHRVYSNPNTPHTIDIRDTTPLPKTLQAGIPSICFLIRETVVCFFTWLAAPSTCVRSGWPGPGMCARDASV